MKRTMQLLDFADIGKQHCAGSVVTIGNFDGIHRGHAGLFRNLKIQGAQLGVPTVVVTFEPHPLAVLFPAAKPTMITSFPQKVKLIEQAGIDCLAVIKFTHDFSQISAESFVRAHLCHSLGMRHIVIGHDYAFGRGRSGNYSTLVDMGAECGFTVEHIKPIGENNTIYSSTLVRRLISSGDMLGAAAVLGRNHVIFGRVAHGSGIGSRLGFPTAKIVSENELIPLNGVYSVQVAVGDQLINGICTVRKNRKMELTLQKYSARLYDGTFLISIGKRLNELKKSLISEYYSNQLPQLLCSTT